jgi:hypothetical protein
MASSGLEELVVRTPFSSSDELVDFLVENRSMSVPKLARQLRLSTFEVRRLLSSSEFRRRSSEFLSLRVLSLEQESRLLQRLAEDALADGTRVSDRVKAAEFLFRQGGVERARETRVDVDHSIRVMFESPRLPPVDWVAPDPFHGVVGAPQLGSGVAGALSLPVEVVDSEPIEAGIEVDFEAG